MLLSLHLILHLFSLHFVKVKKVRIFKIKEKFPLKWFWMLVMPFSGLRQAHPANLPQQVFRRLPAKRHGMLLDVLIIFLFVGFVGETPDAQRTRRGSEGDGE